MPFLGQLLHMGQAVELCNVIEACGLYPSLSERGRDYTSETFRTSFNHVKGGNKNRINKVAFGETMKHLENRKKMNYAKSIKKTIIGPNKLFLQSNPSSGLVYFMIEYYLHIMKMLQSLVTTNDVFKKGNINEGVLDKNYPLRSFHFTARDQEEPIQMTNMVDVVITDQMVGGQQLLLSLRTIAFCVLKTVQETDTPTGSIWETIEYANRDTKLFEHTEEDTMKIEASSNEKPQEKKTENQGGLERAKKKDELQSSQRRRRRKKLKWQRKGGDPAGARENHSAKP